LKHEHYLLSIYCGVDLFARALFDLDHYQGDIIFLFQRPAKGDGRIDDRLGDCLRRLARMLMNQCLEPAVTKHPTFLVKGFTDAVGGEDDDLTGAKILLPNFKFRLSENAQRQSFTTQFLKNVSRCRYAQS